jgi:hypothetical protein
LSFTLSPYAIIAGFKLMNANSDSLNCDVAAYADGRIGTKQTHPIWSLADNQGFD